MQSASCFTHKMLAIIYIFKSEIKLTIMLSCCTLKWSWWTWWRCYFTCDTCYPIFPLQDPHWCRQCLYVSDDQDLDCLTQCVSLAELSDYLSASLNIAGFSWVLPPEGRYAEIEIKHLISRGKENFIDRRLLLSQAMLRCITSRWGGCV